MKKAQGGFEILFAVGLMTFIFLILVYFTFERRSELYSLESYVSEKNDCLKIFNAVTSTFVNGHSTSSTIKLNYNAYVDATSGVITTGPDEYPCTIPVKNTRSQTGQTAFNLTGSYVTIENENGTVVMRNA